MLDTQSALRELERYLSGTPEFAALKKAKFELSQNPSFNTMVNQFQQKQNMLYNQNPQPTSAQLQNMMTQLNAEYENLRKIPQINQYFTAADAFNKFLSDVVQQLHTDIEAMLNWR